MINKIGLEECVNSLNTPGHFYRFHRKESFTCTLSKLAHGLSHTVMADMVVGGDSDRWGKGCSHMMKYLDETFINLTNANSLNLWVSHFPAFAEYIRLKYCSHWEENNDDDGNNVPEAENTY